MNGDLRIGRIGGVEIAVSWGLIAISTLFTISLAVSQYPRAFPGYSTATYWLVGVTATLLFIGSILVHELGHALVARNESVPVEGVTLWMFGGLARLGAPPPTPGADARIALAGPAATGLAAGAFWLLATLAGMNASPSLLQVMFDWLSRTNLLLLGLNLLPALPLDGGRVTAAVLWRWTGSRGRGNLYASRAGWAVAVALVLGGFVAASDGNPMGLWAVLVGWLVVSAARSEERHARLRRAWSGRTAGQLMAPYPPTAEEWMNLDAMAQCVAVHPGGGHHRLYPVRGGDGRLIGALRRSVLEAVPAAERRHVRVIDVVEPMRDVPVVAFDAQVDAVVASHPEAFGLGVFVAGPDGATVGVLGPDELLAAPQRRAGVGAR